MVNLILDSDVMLNWLLQEQETKSSFKLWEAPSVILELGEQRIITNQISMISMMEVRYVLRRKKKWAPEMIEEDIQRMKKIFKIVVPQTSDLEQAEKLQGEEMLDPFDSIILSQAISNQLHLITRDNGLMEIASKYVSVFTPEKYIKECLKA